MKQEGRAALFLKKKILFKKRFQNTQAFMRDNVPKKQKENIPKVVLLEGFMLTRDLAPDV